MNLRRNYIWMLPLSLLLTAPLWWGLAGRLVGPRSGGVSVTPPAERQLNTFVLERVTLAQSRNGSEDLLVRAAQVRSGQGADELEMSGVEGLMTGKERSLKFYGGEASYDQARQVLDVGERVRLETSDGYRLGTTSLRCLVADRQVESEDELDLGGAGMKLRGRGFRYSLATGDFRIGGRVLVDFF